MAVSVTTSQHRSLAALFLGAVASTPDRVALRQPAPAGAGGAWEEITYAELGRAAREIAGGLAAPASPARAP